MTKPEYLKSCPVCGAKSPRWKDCGEQMFPAFYADKASFANALREGVYVWNEAGTHFGARTFNCGSCDSLMTDTPATIQDYR